jgi:hypothetical protein
VNATADDRVVRVVITSAARVQLGDLLDMSDGLHKVTAIRYTTDEDEGPLVRLEWAPDDSGFACFTEQTPDSPMLVRVRSRR